MDVVAIFSVLYLIAAVGVLVGIVLLFVLMYTAILALRKYLRS
jgi:hypothetical protein